MVLACTKEDQSGVGASDRFAMTFGIRSVESMHSTKSIVEDIADLEAACTPIMSPFTLNESIGIWADYDYMGETYKNLLSNVELAFYTKTGGNLDGWNYNYGSSEEYWQLGGVYDFRAYYPQQAIKNADAIVASSSATTFVLNCNTEVLQEDILVGYKSVDTKTAVDLSKPVDMHMQHSMAALRFVFQFKYTEESRYYDEDYLTSCWLRNTDDDGFTTAGMMVYGVTDDGGDYYPERIDWKESYQPYNPSISGGLKFYYWSYDAGVRFANVDDGDDVKYDPEHEVTQATAYSMMPVAASEKIYAGNNGWLMIIPQKSDGSVELCFTTIKGGASNIYSIKLPAVTGTDGDGMNPSGTDWIPGYRYTYTISMTKTDMELLLNLSDWNQLDSSFSVSF